MNIKDINKNPTPIIPINASLAKHKGEVLFPDKLAKANETLAAVGLPKAKMKKGA